jgi:hypothetical protein
MHYRFFLIMLLQTATKASKKPRSGFVMIAVPRALKIRKRTPQNKKLFVLYACANGKVDFIVIGFAKRQKHKSGVCLRCGIYKLCMKSPELWFPRMLFVGAVRRQRRRMSL